MSSGYRVAPLFLIRVAGVPFDCLEKLATSETLPIARALAEAQEECAKASAAAEDFFRSRRQLLAPDVYHDLRVAVRLKRPPATSAKEQPGVFADYAKASEAVAKLESELQDTLERQVQSARASLMRASRRFLPEYLLFGAEGVRDFVNAQLTSEPAQNLLPRNNAARKIEQSLLLYLQRVAGKNDTFSAFGPSSWGRADREVNGLRLEPEPGIAKRQAFLERWTAQTLATAISTDADVFSELRPRLNPNGALAGDKFVELNSGEAVALSPDDLELVFRCDGRATVAKLGAPIEKIRNLIAKRVLLCAMEVPALDPFAFDKLHSDVEEFRPGPARDRWLPLLDELSRLPQEFIASSDPIVRREVMSRARQQLSAVGGERKPGQRSLYSAINPVGEECFRESKFAINPDLLNEISMEAAPWIDFWRDTYCFVATRVAAGLRMVFEKAPTRNGALPLPAFLRACEMVKLPLTGPGLIGLSVMAFQEIKAAFRERMRPHAGLAEYELTRDDCHFVRANFRFSSFEETYPSADLQLAAECDRSVARGRYQWILSELHPPGALLHHAGYWSCPDKRQLNAALARVTGKAFHFGFFAADFTAHTAVRVFDAMPELTTFVAPHRADPAWRSFPPAHTEVYLEESSGDVRLRHAATREDLGSFARNWIIALGFHPFQFGMKPQMPRLRCGRVIVQRRAWTISVNELGRGDFSGVSRALVLAVDRLRQEKDWPRFVYIRPTEEALRRSGAEGRDKDTKPVFIDLESYLFLEIFQRWLMKSGELEVTEMLPAPGDLCWREEDGRRTFELRTLIVARG